MKSSFFDFLASHPQAGNKAHLGPITREQVIHALSKDDLDEIDFLTLISDSADDFLEAMAQKARQLTKKHFGNSVFIFTPLYLSNFCVNTCPYCSFSGTCKIDRIHLSLSEVEKAAIRVSGKGIRHVLALTGEAPQKASPEYLIRCVEILKRHFSAVALEVYPLKETIYQQLRDAGADTLTIYQETYNETAYRQYHQQGPKADFRFRLETPDRALTAGLRGVTIGALLGLHDPHKEAYTTARHLKYLQNTYPWAEISVSLPRLRPVVSDFAPPYPVSDKLFVKLLLAFRLFAPTAGITVSTRESRPFRDAVLPLGVTKMSAGVSTSVGGHDEGTGQFEIADPRSVEEVQADLLRLGYQPVMQDWHHQLSQ